MLNLLVLTLSITKLTNFTEKLLNLPFLLKQNGALWNQGLGNKTCWNQYTLVNGFDSEYRDM